MLLATFIWLLVFTKKVAFTPAAAKSSRVRAVLVGSGASSKVSATVCRSGSAVDSQQPWCNCTFCNDCSSDMDVTGTDGILRGRVDALQNATGVK